jgi:hypothetical protein
VNYRVISTVVIRARANDHKLNDCWMQNGACDLWVPLMMVA